MTVTLQSHDQMLDWNTPDQQSGSFFVRTNSILKKVNFRDILWIHADGNYSYIYTRKQRFAVKISMKKFFEKLSSSQFVRIHKSFIVNLNYVERIDLMNNDLMIGEKVLPIGRVYKVMLLDKLDVL